MLQPAFINPIQYLYHVLNILTAKRLRQGPFEFDTLLDPRTQVIEFKKEEILNNFTFILKMKAIRNRIER